MRDYEIRKSLHDQFLRYYKEDGESIVVDELGVCNGVSIVDLAVVNGSLHAYEIKSDADTLTRLPKQVEQYNKVFDYATVVVSSKYLNKVSQLIPEWWGIWLVYEQNGEVVKNVIRESKRNTNVDAFSVAQLLWRDEALDYLERIGYAKGMKTKRRWLLWEKLVEVVQTHELCANVRLYLKLRSDWKLSHFNSSTTVEFSQNGDFGKPLPKGQDCQVTMWH